MSYNAFAISRTPMLFIIMNMKHTVQSLKTLEKRHSEEWILV